MTNTETLAKPTRMPLVWQDEDAVWYSAEGHVDPWRFMVAVLCDLAENCGPDEVMELLGGATYTPDRGDTIEEWIKNVKHVYAREIKGNDELLERCDVDADGAMAFTQIRL